MNYDYKEAMYQDILDYINENIDLEEYSNRDDLEEYLYDVLFVEDSVTGNASGSYTFNWNTAKEYVTDNVEFLSDAVNEGFAIESEIGKLFIDESWEDMDIIIRCYLLSSVICEVLDDIWE